MDLLIQPQQSARQFLASAGQGSPGLAENDELRADRVLQAPDLAARGHPADTELVGGPVEALRLGHRQKGAQLAPVSPAQKTSVLHRQFADGGRAGSKRMLHRRPPTAWPRAWC